jgi:hypothetical protein
MFLLEPIAVGGLFGAIAADRREPNRWGSAEVSLIFCHCRSSPTLDWSNDARPLKSRQ